MGGKPIVSVTHENERISIKKQLTLQKFVLRLSCVVHGPIYGRVMGGTVNDLIQVYNWELRHHPTVCRRGLADILYFGFYCSAFKGKCWVN